MKKYIYLLIAIIGLLGCTEKQEDFVWQDESFANWIGFGGHEIILEESIPSSIYTHGQVAVRFSNEFIKKSKGGEITYSYKFDSVTAIINEENIEITYNLVGEDSLIIYSKAQFPKKQFLYITIWGTWSYKDSEGTNYTQGEALFFGIEKEELEIKISNQSIIVKAFITFAEEDKEVSNLYVPKLNLKSIPNTNYTYDAFNGGM